MWENKDIKNNFKFSELLTLYFSKQNFDSWPKITYI